MCAPKKTTDSFAIVQMFVRNLSTFTMYFIVVRQVTVINVM